MKDLRLLVPTLMVCAAAIGILDWLVMWLLIDETAEGTQEVCGFSEGNLRAMQNPGTLLMEFALILAWSRYNQRLAEFGRMGLGFTAVALVIVLIGNLVEFGLWGAGPLDSQDPGAAIFFTGLLFLPFGLVSLVLGVGISAGRARTSL